MIKVIDAILAINPDAGVQVYDNDLDQINWDEGTAEIPKEDIQAEMDSQEVAYKKNEYARKRLEEYPSIQECIHAILDDDTVALQEKRQAVKTKYPKS